MDLLLLPGLDGGAALSQPFRGYLPPHFTCEVVHYSPTQAEGYAALEARVRAQLQSRSAPVVLIAESFSGPIALRLCRDPEPNLVALVLVSTFTCPPLAPWLRFLVSSAFFVIPPPTAVIRNLLVGDDAPEHLVEDVRQAIGVPEARVLAHRVREVLGVDVRDVLPDITLPTLCLTSARDRLLKPVNLAALGGEVQYESVDAPHLLLQTRPREAAAKVVAFVDSLPRLP